MSPIHPIDLAPDDTERFTLQACPHCSAVAPVRLSLSTTPCEFCGGCFEVAPLLGPGGSAAVAAPASGAGDTR
jgi:hypothetical protein